MKITMNDLLDWWHSLVKANTGRCQYDRDHKNGMKYEDCLLTYFLGNGRDEISFQQYINKQILEIKSYLDKCGLDEETYKLRYEDEIKKLTSKVANAAISYVSFQSDVDINLGRA